jgi:hypothetical protein
MQMIYLYRYERDGGGVTVSPEKPDKDYTLLYRLVADEGKVLTDGETVSTCVDTDNTAEWTEIEAPEEIKEEKQ